jgi:hypothetical protein
MVIDNVEKQVTLSAQTAQQAKTLFCAREEEVKTAAFKTLPVAKIKITANHSPQCLFLNCLRYK